MLTIYVVENVAPSLFIAPGLYRPVHRNRIGIVRYTFVFEFEFEKETVE